MGGVSRKRSKRSGKDASGEGRSWQKRVSLTNRVAISGNFSLGPGRVKLFEIAARFELAIKFQSKDIDSSRAQAYCAPPDFSTFDTHVKSNYN